MRTVTLNQAESELKTIVQGVINDIEPTIISTNSGDSVIILSLDEYNAWQETLYLLSTPANVEHLRRAIAEDKAGYAVKRDFIEP